MSTYTDTNINDGEAIVDDVNEEEEVLPYHYEIGSYGADYDVLGLVRRMDDSDIVVPTFHEKFSGDEGIKGFQRGFVWTRTQCDRFIESLLLGLPVPGIFLFKQPTNVFLVLDGQQRLKTIQAFYSGVLRGKEFKLGEQVQSRLRGFGYKDLDPEDRRRIDNAVIHATVVRQEKPSDDQSSVYLVFERLNTGGTNLKPHEIRVALYHGGLIELIRTLNAHASWRQLFGKRSASLKDQELILRFFALLAESSNYARPMKKFLNDYAGDHRNPTSHDLQRLESEFSRTADVILERLGPRAFRLERTVNAALVDSLMVGVATRLRTGSATGASAPWQEAYNALMKDKEYKDAISRSTADEESVKTRVSKATEAFQEVP